jgi:hypothetical protein
MASHQLVFRRTDQRLLRVDNDVREFLGCAERSGRVVQLLHPRSCVFVYLRLRSAYHGLLPEAFTFTSQESARQQGFFSDRLKISLTRDCLEIFTNVRTCTPLIRTFLYVKDVYAFRLLV